MNKTKSRLLEMMVRLDRSFVYRLTESDNMLTEDRIIYDDIIKVFQENDFSNNRFITLGYVNGVDIPARVYPTEDKENYVKELIVNASQNGLSEIEVGILNDFIGDNNWGSTKRGENLTTKKTPKSFYEMDSRYKSIIEFKRFQFNFMSSGDLGRNFNNLNTSIYDLRMKHGFGKDDSEYDSTDWRRGEKHRGIAGRPTVADKDINKGSSYKEKMGDFPIYGDVDMEGKSRINPNTNRQRLVLRQNISTGMKGLKPDYFFIDIQGNLNQVSSSFVKFFSKMIKENKSSSIEGELSQDEQLFISQMEQINGLHYVTQFITDKIAYLVASPQDVKTKEKKPLYFINNNIDILDDFTINKDQLYAHIRKYVSMG